MFDPDRYRDACSQLELGQETLEEMIAMVENKPKKRLVHPVRAALIAAACLLALSLTAFAASPAGQELFQTLYVTYHVVSIDPADPEASMGTGTVTVTIDQSSDVAAQGSYTWGHYVSESEEGSLDLADGKIDGNIKVRLVPAEGSGEGETPNYTYSYVTQ